MSHADITSLTSTSDPNSEEIVGSAVIFIIKRAVGYDDVSSVCGGRREWDPVDVPF